MLTWRTGLVALAVATTACTSAPSPTLLLPTDFAEESASVDDSAVATTTAQATADAAAAVDLDRQVDSLGPRAELLAATIAELGTAAAFVP